MPFWGINTYGTPYISTGILYHLTWAVRWAERAGLRVLASLTTGRGETTSSRTDLVSVCTLDRPSRRARSTESLGQQWAAISDGHAARVDELDEPAANQGRVDVPRGEIPASRVQVSAIGFMSLDAFS